MKKSLLFLGLAIGIFITSALTVFFVFTFVMPKESVTSTDTPDVVQQDTQITPIVTEPYTPTECINDPAIGAYCVEE